MNRLPMYRVLITVMALLYSSVLLHADLGTITGLVTDRATGDPLGGVTIRIEGTRQGAISNSNGRFHIKGLPSGNVTIAASLVGYEPTRTQVFLNRDETRDVVFTMLASPIRTNEVVVSANKRVQAVQDVPISVAVMNQADLSRRNITRLDEALGYVSGVTVAKDQVNIRGSSGFAFGVGSRTMVLMDGFPLLSGDNGDIKFDVLPVADIERVEVIKGAGSALYGTGALGGVVSLITKEATDTGELNARIYAGVYPLPKYQQWRYSDVPSIQSGADLRYARAFGQFSVNASGGIRQDQSYRDFDAGVRGFGYTKLGWQPNERTSLKLFALGAVDDKENYLYWESLARATFPPTDQKPDERLRSTKLAAALEFSQILSGTTSLVVRPGVFVTRFENTQTGTPVDSNQSTASTYNAEAQLTSMLSSTTVITAGLNARLNSVRSDVYGNQLQSVVSGYAQAEFTFVDDLIVTAGVRADREETGGRTSQLEFSPKFGMTWHASEQTTLRASVGRGFRAATIAERYARIRYGPFQVSPNENILAESSVSAEIGAHHTGVLLLPVELDIAVFDNELYDLIEPTFDFAQPGSPIVFRNVTRARVLGAEATARMMIADGLGMETGITAMLPRDLVQDNTLPFRNNIIWYSRAFWRPFDAVELQCDYRFLNRVERVDDRLKLFIADADARVPTHIVDARLVWSMNAMTKLPLKLTLGGRNVLNYAYTETVANLGPSQSVFLQLSWGQ
ncbi:MAG: TonB-dependent receptor ['Candidatus Kapabacteria' thiocyanatum]|uniref:TonB-dependent receptor plug domain-containing protein n=1 Tax=Candidatus Kapaibacterium thiocyanatum TaxID=1895771 RepID=A0A1M3L6X4_9BACT|nr:TonB-dependent receptor ['Candidatus Kapabacteria' thiocyanatum]OJX61318.1 MAG: hypothetical protein BGO89_01715 ['Candidatus Kapabacteria' thiocyanatum]